MSFYQQSLNMLEKKSNGVVLRGIENYSDKTVHVQSIFQRKYETINPIPEKRHKKKFKRDSINGNTILTV